MSEILTRTVQQTPANESVIRGWADLGSDYLEKARNDCTDENGTINESQMIGYLSTECGYLKSQLNRLENAREKEEAQTHEKRMDRGLVGTLQLLIEELVEYTKEPPATESEHQDLIDTLSYALQRVKEWEVPEPDEDSILLSVGDDAYDLVRDPIEVI